MYCDSYRENMELLYSIIAMFKLYCIHIIYVRTYSTNNTLQIFIKCAEAWAFLALRYVKANLLTKYKHDQHTKTD